MNIQRFSPGMRDAWNEWVRNSKNGTFLFDRAYMDYHADRFDDHSLVYLDSASRIVAVLPAHRQEATLLSHGGLTYGGLVTGASMSTPLMMRLFEMTCQHLRSIAIGTWRYKTVPSIYHRLPADEDRYALFRFDARVTSVDALSVVLMSNRTPVQERRRRSVKRAERAGLTVDECRDYASFWPILEDALAVRHNVRPVHSLAEITLLAGRFPDNIRLHLCREDSKPLAGIVVYDTGRVAHAQYIAASERGRDVGALDHLVVHLLDVTYADRRYFDFGASTESAGRSLNVGLIEFKEGFGARTVVHDCQEVTIP
jgi:hypothetical protein